MKRDELRDREDRELFGDPEITAILSSRRRNTPLGFVEVEKLVYALRPGMARRANLEKYADCWRLRFVVFDVTGTKRRRSIVIEDASIMEWVREYLAEARRQRGKYNNVLWIGKLEEYRRQLRNEGDDRFVIPGKKCLRLNPGNDIVTGKDQNDGFEEYAAEGCRRELSGHSRGTGEDHPQSGAHRQGWGNRCSGVGDPFVPGKQ